MSVLNYQKLTVEQVGSDQLILNNLEEKYLDFKLGDEQKNALLQVFSYIGNREEKIISIFGAAGTGKSTLTKLITRYLEQKQIGYVLATPTHKSKGVLASYTERDVTTIHKLLALQPTVDILELDYKDLQFSSKSKSDGIPRNGVLIIDECSMVNDALYDFILKRGEERNCLIIWQGDKCQIQPVKDYKLSKTFTEGKTLELTKIYRQKGDNPILDVLDILRSTPLKVFPKFESEKGSMYHYSNWKHFIEANKQLFIEAVKDEDPCHVKLIAYTNRRVSAFNEVIRKELGFTDEYNVGEILVGYDNCDEVIVNSADYIVRAVRPGNFDWNGIQGTGFYLTLYSLECESQYEVFILSNTNSLFTFQEIGYMLEDLRIGAINASKTNKKLSGMLWRRYFEFMGSFLTPIDISVLGRVVRKKSLDFGYCITCHKSQSSNYDHILVDMSNILLCDRKEELRQLQYVAMSRTRKDIHMLIK